MPRQASISSLVSAVAASPSKVQLPALVEIADRLVKGVLADPIKSLLVLIQAGVGNPEIESTGFFLSTAFTGEQRLIAFELVAQISHKMLKQIPKHARKRAQALLCSSNAVAELQKRANSATLSGSESSKLRGVYEELVRYTGGRLTKTRQQAGAAAAADSPAAGEVQPDSFGSDFVKGILEDVMSNNRNIGNSLTDVFQTDVNILKESVRFQPGLGMAAAFRQKQLRETVDSSLSPVRLGKMLSPTTSIKQEFLDLQADQKERNQNLKKLKPLKNPRVEARARQVAAGFQHSSTPFQPPTGIGLTSPYAENLTLSMRTKQKRTTRQEAVRQYMASMTGPTQRTPLASTVHGAESSPQRHNSVGTISSISANKVVGGGQVLTFEPLRPDEESRSQSKSIVDEYMQLYKLKMQEYEDEMSVNIPPRPSAVSSPGTVPRAWGALARSSAPASDARGPKPRESIQQQPQQAGQTAPVSRSIQPSSSANLSHHSLATVTGTPASMIAGLLRQAVRKAALHAAGAT